MARIDINYNEIDLVDEAGGLDTITFDILVEFINKIKASKGLLQGYHVVEREEVAANATLIHRPLVDYFIDDNTLTLEFAEPDGTTFTVSAAIPEGAVVPS